MPEIAALTAFARNDMVTRHCEGLAPKQSHAWSKCRNFFVLMPEIAALTAFARNDMVARHCEGLAPKQSPA